MARRRDGFDEDRRARTAGGTGAGGTGGGVTGGGVTGRRWAVLDVVDTIPPGRVMTYGDIARYLGIPSARQVGQILARSGHEVPWHRVVMADGSPASPDAAEQAGRLRADGTPMRGGRVDLAAARWRPDRAAGEAGSAD